MKRKGVREEKRNNKGSEELISNKRKGKERSIRTTHTHTNSSPPMEQQQRFVSGPGAKALNAFNLLIALVVFATTVYRFFIGSTDLAYYVINCFLL